VHVSRTTSAVERQFGEDSNGFYLYTPRRRWRNVVVFVHGHGGAGEITPKYHDPWLQHLARRGSVVIYPRYEDFPGGHAAAKHIVRAVRAAYTTLGPSARGLPRIGIGYSRGGRLVVDWAAIAPRTMKPRAILSVFPGSSEDASPDLSTIRRGTRILILVGDHDEVVGGYGALALVHALAQSRFGLRTVSGRIVKSSPGFTVTHLSVLESSRRARVLFWRPADRLIANVGG
jgi:predicted esterase